MAYLEFISDAQLELEVRHLLEVAQRAKQQAETRFDKNVIDPFAALFEIAGFQSDYEGWHKTELIRQSQKTLQNQIGMFHQKILGHVEGWEDLGVGAIIDLACQDRKIIAEVKNKYNTVSGGKLAELYESLEKLVMPKASRYKDFTVYYVTIIPKKPERLTKPFTPSNKEKGARCADNTLIKEIDGNSFYELVTGRKQALQELYAVLPQVIDQVLGQDYCKEDDMVILTDYFKKAFG